MAFYFALFNVSNVNQELKGRNKARKRERRRHSLASHVASDYRLLPKPKIILHDTNATDNETVSTLLDESGDDDSSAYSSKFLDPKDSLKHRRVSSPETRRAMELPSTVSRDDELEQRLKRVKLTSSEQPRSQKMNTQSTNVWTEGPEEEQVWVKRSHPPPDTSYDDPWVYFIELEKKNRQEKMLSENGSNPSERQRPRMGVSALQLSHQNEQNRLRDDLRRHVNTWPEVRTNRTHWRPSLLLRRHSGGNLNDRSQQNFGGFLQRCRGSVGNQIPYQSIGTSTPSHPQDPQPTNKQTKFQGSQITVKMQKPSSNVVVTLPPKPPKQMIVIVPTPTPTPTPMNRPSSSSSNGLRIWTWGNYHRTRNIPFVRLNNESFEQSQKAENMIRSSVF